MERGSGGVPGARRGNQPVVLRWSHRWASRDHRSSRFRGFPHESAGSGCPVCVRAGRSPCGCPTTARDGRSAPARDAPLALADAGRAVRVVVDARCAGVRQAAELLVREHEVGCTEVVLELRHGAGTEDDARDRRAGEQPGEGDLRPRRTVRVGDGGHRVEHLPRALVGVPGLPRLHAALRVLAQAGRAGGGLVALVLAGEPTAGQRRPGQQADAGVEAGRDDLVLDVANEQVVLRLQRHRRCPAVRLRLVDGLRHLVAEVVREPVGADLAGGHGVVEEAQGLLDRRQGVPRVHLVQVDVLDAEPLERGVEGDPEVSAGQPEVVRAVALREAALRGEDDLLRLGRVRGEPAADDPLGLVARVDVGRVDEGAAGGDERVDDLVGGGFVGFAAERHGAEGQRRHRCPAVAEESVVHGRDATPGRLAPRGPASTRQGRRTARSASLGQEGDGRFAEVARRRRAEPCHCVVPPLRKAIARSRKSRDVGALKWFRRGISKNDASGAASARRTALSRMPSSLPAAIRIGCAGAFSGVGSTLFRIPSTIATSARRSFPSTFAAICRYPRVTRSSTGVPSAMYAFAWSTATRRIGSASGIPPSTAREIRSGICSAVCQPTRAPSE
ncbi:hypothetical protein Cus16_2920 [Curtobacterium sp. ER1/6]|nr:hypothetical protein Cus16_2920 [Curtobacterium sp. ER1/6]